MITKTCSVSGKEFVITDEDLAFYEKMGLGEPTLCPEERERRRLAFRNDRNLYRRDCDATGKKIISMYSSLVSFPVFDRDYWWSDSFDPLAYGVNFDFDRPFFDQFQSLYDRVPRFSKTISNSTNCDYNNYCADAKDCYMSQRLGGSEGAYYSYLTVSDVDVCDCYNTDHNELLYGSIDCSHCFNALFLQNCRNCSDSFFLKNCIGCRNCFGCVNLRNKEYYYLNESFSKSEYEQKIEKLNLSRRSRLYDLEDMFRRYTVEQSHKYLEGIQNESVSGNYLSNCKNVKDSFDCLGLEDARYCWGHVQGSDAYDTSFNYDCKFVYEFAAGVHSQELVCCYNILSSSQLAYCIDCVNGTKDCFGCIGLKNVQYCIFNQQYSKEDYFSLRKKIVAHLKEAKEWGEFFPISMSPFGYNETVAHEYYPLNEDAVLSLGATWSPPQNGAIYDGPVYQVADDISDVSDSILESILVCENTGKNYRIVKPELQFYRKMNLPIPKLCPDERHRQRISSRNTRSLWDRKCDECKCEMRSTFSLDRPERVLCESCYEEEVN